MLVLWAAACQGPPPTQIILVVTATPTPEETIQADGTVESQAVATSTALPIVATPSPAASVNPSPTAIVNQIQVAEQVFEHGRMFWLQPTGQIWVMIVEEEGQGRWQIFDDTFEDGELEFDPEIVPPQGFEQPQRGFGKLWRDNPELRESLGWAITPEFGFVTRYEYHADPGYHLLSSLYEETFRFNEADRSWQLN
jgi:hypothetical protein